MGVIHVENVDEQVMRSIRLRAQINGRSFEDEVKALLAEAGARKMTSQERTARLRQIQAMTPEGVEQTDSTEIIRELRDLGYAGR